MTEIITATIGAIATIVVALLGLRATRKQKGRAEQAEREIVFQSAALDFDGFFGEWKDIHDELQHLCDTTCIDRFLVLRAFNGKAVPRWVNAVFQYREGAQKPVSYIHVALDEDYIERLRRITSGGSISFRVSDIPDSLIKGIYESEHVKSSAWFHIGTYDLESSDTRMIAFCSFATHEDVQIPEEVLVRCRLIANRFQRIADSLAGDAVPVNFE
jgi:hypothetical protein